MQDELLAPGCVIAGKYVIERTLGRGGMGAVYVVSHAQTGKRLALKVLLPEFVNSADLIGRFLREAQVMGRLAHRHVVDVLDVGRDGDVLFIVMALLDGKPLSELLHDESLTLEEALVILLRAMEGIAAAHDLGIIHRDIKPDNIFVCLGPSGRLDDPRVLDFGISKLDDGVAQQLTQSGVAMGTPYYMSIEQLNGQRDLDQRVDVYAMGVILYEAIAGVPPYTADSISALAIRVLTTEPVHLGELRPDLPPGLADIVMKALAKRREERHSSMRQLIVALRPFVPSSAGLLVPEGQGRPLRTPRGARGTPLPPSEVASPSAPPPWLEAHSVAASAAPPRSRLLRGVAVLLALLVVAGLGALFATRRGEEPVLAGPRVPEPARIAAPAGIGAAAADEPVRAVEAARPRLPAAAAGEPVRAVEAAQPRPSPTAPLTTGEGGAAGTSARTGAGQAVAADDVESARRGSLSAGSGVERTRGDKPQRPLAAPEAAAPRSTASSAGPRASTSTPEKRSSRRRVAEQPPTVEKPPPAKTESARGPDSEAARPGFAAPSARASAADGPPPPKSAEGRAGRLGSDEF